MTLNKQEKDGSWLIAWESWWKMLKVTAWKGSEIDCSKHVFAGPCKKALAISAFPLQVD